MLFLSLVKRYSFSRHNRHLVSNIKIALTFAVSLAFLMVILSVMQMLQNSRFEDIREIRSFDIVVEDASLAEIKRLYPEERVFSYAEGYALIDGLPFIIRYIDSDYDGGLNILTGTEDTILIPVSLYMKTAGRALKISTLSERDGRNVPLNYTIYPSGVYFTALSGDFDSQYAFMPYADAPQSAKHYIAIKGSDDVSPLENAGITSYRTWKESESTLYSAFALEKWMMIAVLLVLFLIVYIEIRQEAHIFLSNKKKERLELLLIGYGRGKSDAVFIFSFLFMIFLGMLVSIVLQEVALDLFSLTLHRSYGYSIVLQIDYPLFFALCILFLLLTALTLCLMLRREGRLSLMEVLHE